MENNFNFFVIKKDKLLDQLITESKLEYIFSKKSLINF